MLSMTVRVRIEKDGATVYRDFPISDLKFKKNAESDKDDGED